MITEAWRLPVPVVSTSQGVAEAHVASSHCARYSDSLASYAITGNPLSPTVIEFQKPASPGPLTRLVTRWGPRLKGTVSPPEMAEHSRFPVASNPEAISSNPQDCPELTYSPGDGPVSPQTHVEPLKIAIPPSPHTRAPRVVFSSIGLPWMPAQSIEVRTSSPSSSPAGRPWMFSHATAAAVPPELRSPGMPVSDDHAT